MTVKVQLSITSEPVVHVNVKNAYQKGDFYCVYENGGVFKYPIRNIWRVWEEYVKPSIEGQTKD